MQFLFITAVNMPVPALNVIFGQSAGQDRLKIKATLVMRMVPIGADKHLALLIAIIIMHMILGSFLKLADEDGSVAGIIMRVLLKAALKLTRQRICFGREGQHDRSRQSGAQYAICCFEKRLFHHITNKTQQ